MDSPNQFKHLTPNEKCATLRNAVAFDNIDIVRVLVNDQIDLDSQDILGMTALMWAMQYKRIEIATLLIQSGANLYLTNKNGKNALMIVKEQYQNSFFDEEKQAYEKLVSLLNPQIADQNEDDKENGPCKNARPVIFSKRPLDHIDFNIPTTRTKNLPPSTKNKECSIF